MNNTAIENSSPVLRIAVVGVGGIGSTFAFQLSREGRHDVTVVARSGSARLEQLLLDGGIVNTKGKVAQVHVTDRLDEEVPYDLVLVTLLAYQAETILPALARSAAKQVQFMFNTFQPEHLRDAVGAERCSFGMPFVQASIGKDGRLAEKIGAGGQKSKMNSHAMVQIFNAAALPAVFEPDMLLWLRCHAPLCIAFESVCAAGLRHGSGASWREAKIVASGLRECFTLIKRFGYQLYPSGKVFLHRSPTWLVTAMLWTISRNRSFRELLGTGVNECRSLIDVVVAESRGRGTSILEDRITAMRP